MGRGTNLAVFLAALTGCVAREMLPTRGVRPDQPTCIVDALLRYHGDDWYCVTVTIQNNAAEPIALNSSRFELLAAPPCIFVPSPELSFRRGRFAMPEEVVPNGTARGELFFIARGASPRYPVEFVAHMPDGDHSFEFAKGFTTTSPAR